MDAPEGLASYEGGLAVYRRGPATAELPVVLVHGSMDRAAAFVKTVRLLPGRRTVRYDRRGYGRSADAPLVATIAEQVDDLLGVVGDEPSVVVGHSLGGVLALAAAQRRSDLVRALFVFEAPMPWAEWWPRGSAGGQAVDAAETIGLEAAAERFMRRMIGDARWEALPDATKATRRREGRTLINELRAMREGPRPYDVAAIRTPLVVGHGTASEAQHQEGARELARLVAGAELHAIDGAGHGAPTSHPAPFAALVRRAIERAAG